MVRKIGGILFALALCIGGLFATQPEARASTSAWCPVGDVCLYQDADFVGGAWVGSSGAWAEEYSFGTMRFDNGVPLTGNVSSVINNSSAWIVFCLVPRLQQCVLEAAPFTQVSYVGNGWNDTLTGHYAYCCWLSWLTVASWDAAPLAAKGKYDQGLPLRVRPYSSANTVDNGVRLPYNASAKVDCYLLTEAVSGWGGSSSIWDYIEYTDNNGTHGGFDPDTWVDTGVDVPPHSQFCQVERPG